MSSYTNNPLSGYSKAQKVIESITSIQHIKGALNYIINFYIFFNGTKDRTVQLMYDTLKDDLKAKEAKLTEG